MNNGEKCGKQGKHTDFNPVNEAMDHLSTVFTGTVVSTRCSWLLCIIPEVFPVSISMFPSGTLSNSGSAWLVNMLVSWVEERKVVEWICSFLKKERVCFHRSMKSENRDWNENMTERFEIIVEMFSWLFWKWMGILRCFQKWNNFYFLFERMISSWWIGLWILFEYERTDLDVDLANMIFMMNYLMRKWYNWWYLLGW